MDSLSDCGIAMNGDAAEKKLKDVTKEVEVDDDRTQLMSGLQGSASQVSDCASGIDENVRYWESFANLKLTMNTDTGVDDVYPFQDLIMWRNNVTQPLQLVYKCMQDVQDWDMAEATSRTHDQVLMLVEKAVTVLLSFAKTSGTNMGPYLRESRAKGKKTRAANTVGVAQGVFVDLRKQASDARSMYLELLEQVRYMIRCNMLSIDFWFMKFAESETKCAEHKDEVITLHRASVQLDHSLKAIENCSVFWLLVHSSELDLESLKSTSAILRKELVKGREWPQRFEHFCAAVEHFCEQYMPLHNSISAMRRSSITPDCMECGQSTETSTEYSATTSNGF